MFNKFILEAINIIYIINKLEKWPTNFIYTNNRIFVVVVSEGNAFVIIGCEWEKLLVIPAHVSWASIVQIPKAITSNFS